MNTETALRLEKLRYHSEALLREARFDPTLDAEARRERILAIRLAHAQRAQKLREECRRSQEGAA